MHRNMILAREKLVGQSRWQKKMFNASVALSIALGRKEAAFLKNATVCICSGLCCVFTMFLLYISVYRTHGASI